MTYQKPSTCQGCALEHLSQGFSRIDGTGSNGVLIVGEALGEKEKLFGYPFVPSAESGSILGAAFRLLKLRREDFALWNIIACQPPNNKLEGQSYESDAVSHCYNNHFKKVMERVKPKVIIAFGNVAFRKLTGLTDRKIIESRGYLYDCVDYPDVKVIPSIHPSFIARQGRKLITVLKRDLQAAVDYAAGRVAPFETNYETRNDSLGLERILYMLEEDSTRILSYDIETPDTLIVKGEEEIVFSNATINSIQFAVREHPDSIPYCVFAEWNEMTLPLIRKILATPNTKCGWNNWWFDTRVIEYVLGKGSIVNGSKLYDLMWCLDGKTKIALANGNFVTIKWLVNNKFQTAIKTMDEGGNIVTTDIVGWHKNYSIAQTWLKISNDGNRYKIYCTPDHEVWTSKGWVKSENLSIGDTILLPNKGCDEFIHGSLLGDGYYNVPARSLHVTHGECQKAYAQAKAKYLGVKLHSNSDINGYDRVYFSATCSRKWRTMFYTSKGKKRFIPPTSKRAMAIWYMDDWNYKAPTPENRLRYGLLRVCLAGYTNKEEVMTWFNSTNLARYGSITSHNDGGRYILCVSGKAVDLLCATIAEFVHPSMSYKLPIHLQNKYNGWLDTNKPQTATITAIEKTIKSGYRYCLSVAHPTHRFFTQAGLVSNCWKHLHPHMNSSSSNDEVRKTYTKIRGLKSLQFAANFASPEFPAWKHLSATDPRIYGCRDVDATDRLAHWMIGIMSNAKTDAPNAKTLLEGYEDDMMRLRPILDDMQKRGVPIHKEKRDALSEKITARIIALDEEIQDLFPDSLRVPKQANGLKKVPKEVQQIALEMTNMQKISNAGFVLVADELGDKAYFSKVVEYYTRDDIENYGYSGYVQRTFRDKDTKQIVKRWCRVKPFSAQSKDQVLSYIKYKKYKLPDNIDNKKQDYTSKDKLTRIYEKYKDPLIYSILLQRELLKMYATYIKGWKLGADGRVHTTYTFNPESGQLGSERPNVQNCYDEHTQVLTKDGWKFFRDTTSKDRFAEANIDVVKGVVNRRLRYSKATSFHSGLTNEFVDIVHPVYGTILRVTPNHNMVIYNKSDKSVKWIPAYQMNRLKNKQNLFLLHKDLDPLFCLTSLMFKPVSFLCPRPFYCVSVPRANLIVRRKEILIKDGDDYVPLVCGNSPAKGNQFSSPEYKTLANEFRQTIHADVGKKLVEIDYRGLHARMLAFEAESEKYLRLVTLGAHDYLVAYIVRDEIAAKKLQQLKETYRVTVDTVARASLQQQIDDVQQAIEYINSLEHWMSLDDVELGKRLDLMKKCFKHQRETQAKPAIHGFGFGMQPRKFYMLNKEAFHEMKEAEQIHDIYKNEFPDIFVYHEYMKKLADKNKFVLTRYGYIRWFFDVYDHRPITKMEDIKRELRPGEARYQNREGKWWIRRSGSEASEVIAFRPSNNAFGRIKEAMRELRYYDMDKEFGLCNNLHDALFFHCEAGKVDRLLEHVPHIMSKPTKYLVNKLAPNGLECPVEWAVGTNWGKWTPENVEGMK